MFKAVLDKQHIVALKVLHKAPDAVGSAAEQLKQFEAEVHLLRGCNSANIVRVMGAWLSPVSISQTEPGLGFWLCKILLLHMNHCEGLLLGAGHQIFVAFAAGFCSCRSCQLINRPLSALKGGRQT